MQAQTTRQGYPGLEHRGTTGRLAFAGAVLIGLLLAGTGGYWLKGISLHSSVAVASDLGQAPDLADGYVGAQTCSELPLDAIEEEQMAGDGEESPGPLLRGHLGPDSQDLNRTARASSVGYH